MARNKEGKQPLCPLEYGLDIFNGKWKTRIICLLGASGTLRYKEIRENLDGLTDAVLAATLRDMVNDRIVDRRQYNEIPPRVEYSLSEKGASAHKILRSISLLEYDGHTLSLAARRLRDMLTEDAAAGDAL